MDFLQICQLKGSKNVQGEKKKLSDVNGAYMSLYKIAVLLAKPSSCP